MSVVFLGGRPLNTPEEQTRFIRRVGDEVSKVDSPGLPLEIPGLPKGLIPVPSTILQISRERVDINLAEERSSFDKAYPEPGQDFARLGTLVEMAIECTDNWVQPKAVGFNVDFVRDLGDTVTAFQFLSKRLLNPKLSLPEVWGHQGIATTTIIFGGDQPNVRWQVQLEPRLGDFNSPRLFAAVNLHIDWALRQFEKGDVKTYLDRALQHGGAFVEGL